MSIDLPQTTMSARAKYEAYKLPPSNLEELKKFKEERLLKSMRRRESKKHHSDSQGKFN